MKKLLILIGVVGLLSAVGCNPMDDIYDEIDTSLKVEGTVDYTLTDDDYSSLDLSHSNFSSIDEAKALIPALLKKKYPAFTANSLAKVTFNIYDPISIKEYTVTDSDYNEAGLSTDYVTEISDIQDILKFKYPQAKEGDYVKLTYNAIATPIQDTLTNDDYDLIGTELASQYSDAASSAAYNNDFDKRTGKSSYWTDDMIAEAILVVLNDRIDDASEGELYAVTYDTFNDNYEHVFQTMTFRYDGNEFSKFNSTPDGEYYQYTQSDYSLVATELADEYPTAASNLADHGNFYRKYTDNSSYWTDEMLIDAASVVLNEHFPDAADGKVFEIEFDTYGASNTETLTLVKNGNSYEPATSISITEETNVFAYTNGTWNEPLTLEKQDYYDMGLNYPDFDNMDDAAYKIGIFLNKKYPYAEPGDMVAVAFDYYSGGLRTRYANFIFEDGAFQYIPAVKEKSLQFGYDGSTWVPDNTIQYTFTTADYNFVAVELKDVYPDAASNLLSFGNFNRTGGSTSWNDEMMLDAINVVLDNLDPGAEVGQKYQVSYTIYAGGYSIETKSVIKAEDGTWVYN
ncbi:hypothetical protein C7S20_06595 [Christiangramia fulva]|uniref:DUF5017 domain-containing protein n=1 Tax=Christiangramia fulva TaxID=2126553 RepID=A0A2R3Z3W7_9FLAO|nr:hypothetical protein [Christiangramia fulva]AVR44966.1 hypothetical protein C7S20_06595 [Christiangramia fulva]